MSNSNYNELIKNTMPHRKLQNASPYPQKKFGFVSTSDGRMGFLAENYKSHTSGTDNTRGYMYWIKVKMMDRNEPELFLEYMTKEEREIVLQELCDILYQNKNA